jgi:hypothetical protein
MLIATYLYLLCQGVIPTCIGEISFAYHACL